MSAVVNPFFHRGPVRDTAYFFGRQAELAYLAELLQQGQSLSLSGPRRIGKTSLLFHLAHPAIATQWGLGPNLGQWVYLDGGTLDGLDEEWFYGAIDRALGGEADAVPYARFIERLRALAAQGQRLWLALDEFELIAANTRLGPAFFNRLRGLATQYPLQFITASKDPLWQLTFAHSETLSSPFFNIFAPVRLGLLTPPEAESLLTTLATRAGQTWSPHRLAAILAFAGPHPLFLQVTAYRAFTMADDSATAQAALHAAVQTDLEQHLRYYWQTLDAEAQYTLAALPLINAEAHPPAVERLTSAGLLYQGNYLGQVLENFVRQQSVEGLLQGGPFLLDLRRGLVAVHGQRVHLTPTEFAALRLFLEHPGEMLPPETIEAALWPGEITTDPERARNVVKKLRAALGPGGEAIVNRRGQGYLLVVDNP